MKIFLRLILSLRLPIRKVVTTAVTADSATISLMAFMEESPTPTVPPS